MYYTFIYLFRNLHPIPLFTTVLLLGIYLNIGLVESFALPTH